MCKVQQLIRAYFKKKKSHCGDPMGQVASLYLPIQRGESSVEAETNSAL